MTRYKGTCAYDGSGFEGFQSQKSKRTVQGVLEGTLESIFGRTVRVHGTGRTDAGVHAKGQVFHFDATWPHGEEALRKALEAHRRKDLQVICLEDVPPDFHARFSVKRKIYSYHLVTTAPLPWEAPYVWYVPWPLQLEVLGEALKYLEGTHDFRHFTAKGGERESGRGMRGDRNGNGTIKTLETCGLRQEAKQLIFVFEARAFLYRMVRWLSGALVQVARGKATVEQLLHALNHPDTPKPQWIETAPPNRLFLDAIVY